MEKIIELNSIDLYNSLYGFETRHPLVTVADLREARIPVNDIQLSYGLYSVFLKLYKSCDIRYGRRAYDYQEGTIVCYSPRQSICVTNSEEASQPRTGLLYHPDLIRSTSHGKTAQEHIQEKIIDLAKERILETEDSVSQIAYLLGFQYCRLFKKRVGCTPNEYRMQN